MYDALVYMMGTMKVLARSISLKGKLFSMTNCCTGENTEVCCVFI